MAAKKILFLVGDFAEDYEVMVPFQALTALGHVVHAVCPGKKDRRQDQDRDPRFRRRPDVYGKAGPQFHTERQFCRSKPRQLRRTDDCRRTGARVSAARPARDRDRSVFRRGGQADRGDLPCGANPPAADVIRGRRVSAYAACAPEVRLAGGEYVETSPEGAIRDGNLVTGFAWSAHPQFLALFLEVLGTRVSL
jgi:protease I